MQQSPFSNGGSPTPDNQGDTRFTYFPTAAVTTDNVTQPNDVSTAAIGQVQQGNLI